MLTFKPGLHIADRALQKGIRVLTYAGLGQTYQQFDDSPYWQVLLDNNPIPQSFKDEEIIVIEGKTRIFVQILLIGISCITQSCLVNPDTAFTQASQQPLADNESHVIIDGIQFDNLQSCLPSVSVIVGNKANSIEPGTRIVAAGHFNRFWDMTQITMIPTTRQTTWPLDRPNCWERYWGNLEGDSSNFPLFAAWLEFVSQDDPRLSNENRPNDPNTLGVLLLAAKIIGNSVIWEYTAP
jgi:hypothetical protein